MTTTTIDTGALRWMLDDGHGWLLVSRHAYPDAVEYADRYCYATHDVVALEEDCAAGRFLLAHPELDDVEPFPTVIVHGDAPCRSWARCADGRKSGWA